MLPPRSRGHKKKLRLPSGCFGRIQFWFWSDLVLVLVGSSSGFSRIQFWFWSDPVLVLIRIQLWFWSDPVLVLVGSSSGVSRIQFWFWSDPVLVLVGSSAGFVQNISSEFNISQNFSQYLLIWIQVWGLWADLDPKSLYNQSPFHFRKQMGKKILLVKDVSFDVTSNDNKLCISSYFIA